jgi:hypothetical protein
MASDFERDPRGWLRENQGELMAVLGSIQRLTESNDISDSDLVRLVRVLRGSCDIVLDLRARLPRRAPMKWPRHVVFRGTGRN